MSCSYNFWYWFVRYQRVVPLSHLKRLSECYSFIGNGGKMHEYFSIHVQFFISGFLQLTGCRVDLFHSLARVFEAIWIHFCLLDDIARSPSVRRRYGRRWTQWEQLWDTQQPPNLCWSMNLRHCTSLLELSLHLCSVTRPLWKKWMTSFSFLCRLWE